MMILMHNTLRFFAALRRVNRANFSTGLPPEAIVFADQDTIICWHPKQPFPYACTKPLPEEQCESKSALKIGDKEVSEVFRKKKSELMVQELAKMTYTTKHRWYPRSRDRKAKKTEMDRTYL